MTSLEPSIHSFTSETGTPIVHRRVSSAAGVQPFSSYGQAHSTSIPSSAQTSPAHLPSSPFTPFLDGTQSMPTVNGLGSYWGYNALALTSVPLPMSSYGPQPTPSFPLPDVLASNALQISSFPSHTTTTDTSPSGDEQFLFGPLEITEAPQPLNNGQWQPGFTSDGEPQPGTVHGHDIDIGVGSSSSPKLDLKKRTRSVQACERCRRRKARCFGGEPCDRCTKRNYHCEFAQNVRQRGPNRSRSDLKSPKQANGTRKVPKVRRHSMPHSHSHTNTDLPMLTTSTNNFGSLSLTESQAVRALPPETSLYHSSYGMDSSYGHGLSAPMFNFLPTPSTDETLLPNSHLTLSNSTVALAASLPSASYSFSPLDGASPTAPVITPDSDTAPFDQQAVLSRSAPSTVPSFSSLPTSSTAEFPFTPMTPSSGFPYEIYSAEPHLSSTPVYNSMLPPTTSAGLSTPDGIILETTPDHDWYSATA